jgi:putative sporulation protein YtaF
MHGLHLLSTASLAISSSADNVGVGIAFGIRGTNLPLASNIFIAAITGSGTLLSMLAGKTMASFLKPEAATVLGGLVIIVTGVWIIVQEIRRQHGTGSPEM